MKKTIVAWGCLAALGLGPVAQGAELALEGSSLVVTGALDGENAQRFAEHMGSGKVRTVVFEESDGGVPEVAERYAQAIRAAGAITEVRGLCHAACAYAFLAGREHRFGRGLQVNSLLIPLRERSASLEMEKTLVEFRTPPTALASAPERPPWQPAQGLMVRSLPTFFGRIYTSYWCDGTQGRDPSKCALLSDFDPYKLGVLSP